MFVINLILVCEHQKIGGQQIVLNPVLHIGGALKSGIPRASVGWRAAKPLQVVPLRMRSCSVTDCHRNLLQYLLIHIKMWVTHVGRWII